VSISASRPVGRPAGMSRQGRSAAACRQYRGRTWSMNEVVR
jgi:hypothetical protein